MGKLALILGFLALACPQARADTPPSPAPATPNTLRVRLAKDLVTLDWTKSVSEVDRPVISNLQDGLFSLGPDGELVAVLAKDWKRSADSRKFEITLKPGIKWSDGKPFVAEHAVDGMKRLLSPFTASGQAHLLFDVKNARAFAEGRVKDFDEVGIRALGSDRIQIELERDVPDFMRKLAYRATYPVREDLIRKHGALWTRPGHLAVTGPYVLLSHEHGRSIVLRRNPHYGGKRGNIERIEFQILDEEQASEAFKAAKLDLVYQLEPTLLKEHVGKAELKYFPALRTKRLSFNLKKYPISDSRVREMIARCIDRDAIAAKLGPGYQAGKSFAPPSVSGHHDKGGHPHDFTGARRLFRDNFSVMESLKVSFVVPAFDENAAENETAAQVIRDSLKECLKLPVDMEVVRTATQWPLMSRSGTFSMILHDWKPDVPDGQAYYSLYGSDSRLTAQWRSPEYDALLKRASSMENERARKPIYVQADQLLTHTHTVMIPLYYHSEGVLVGKRIQSFKADPYDPYSVREFSIR